MSFSSRFATVSVVLALGLSGCTASWAPQVNPVPYYTYYPASLAVVTAAAEKALPQAGMQFTGAKQLSPTTVEVHGYDSEGNAVLINLTSKGAAVTKFSARIGLYGHLQEVQQIEHWMGRYVGQAISKP